MFLLAGVTLAIVTVSLAFMFAAFEGFLAFLAALEDRPLFTTFSHSLSFPTVALDQLALMLTGLAFPTMA